MNKTLLKSVREYKKQSILAPLLAETTIRERIKEIRKKFKGYQEEPIKTIWGVGYQWEKNQ